ncbi:MAG: ROK family protein [Candidatus Microbacterium phytovorans]|uniref:ROK family protein n=1 Tax=Candidatus Microbacterium phytovorans TaxID=3121374 RepID=A0AAJ5W0U9_9MICO|nr:ROK family protein [Microbacterium sp.]WEK13677.1 MAG: ROK family protein [Microbacterium sp.]
MRLGFDVGGTKTDAVAVAPDGEIVARLRRPTGWGADAVVGTIADAVVALCADIGHAPSELDSIGIGIPGQVAEGTARISHAVNLGIETLDLGAAVGPLFGVPVRAENDVKAAAVGAFALRRRARAREASGSLAYLNLGTGVAAGIVRDGRLWRGARGTAGEVGHIPVDPRGPRCRCGQRGCIEALAGGGAVAQRWGEPGILPVRDVFDAADAGDPTADGLRRDLAYGVAAAVRILVLTEDAETVVLGGGLTALGDRLLAPLVAELEASAAESTFLRSLHLPERIELLPPGSPAAALGAALIGATAHEQEVLAHG